MGVKIEIDRRAIRRKFYDKREQLEDAFERGVNLAMGQMLIRTSKGKSVDGSTFQKYSKQYEKKRKKRQLPVNRVDHMFTGKMLQSITARKVFRSVKRVVVFIFPSAAEKEKVRYTDKLRNWFGLSKKEKETIISEVKTTLNKKRGT